MSKTVNEHMRDQICAVNNLYGSKKYKTHQKQLNFLYKVHALRGRDHLISMGEVKRCKLDPIQP